jgi:hypothetical protein
MIYAKLLEFQKKGITIVKDSTNPHFKNKYADLNEVLDKVKGVLNNMGVVIVQTPTETGLKTILKDTEDDTEVEGFLPWTNTQDPQKLGGNITYYRRYSLISMLGLEDEDDDGNTGAGHVTPKTVTTAPITTRR